LTEAAGKTASEIHAGASKALGIPGDTRIQQDWGAATNTRYFDEAKKEAFKHYTRRLAQIERSPRNGTDRPDPEILEVTPLRA